MAKKNKKDSAPKEVLPQGQRKASDDSVNKPGTGFTAVLLACFVMIGWAVVVAKDRAAASKTEAEVLAELRAESGEEAPAVTAGEHVFPADLQDPNFTAELYRITRDLHGPIGHCVETTWPGAPANTLVRITSDPLGSMMTLAVQGASPEAEACLIKVLSKANYPRKSDHVSDFRLDPSGASIEEIGGVLQPAPADGKPGRVRKDFLPSKPGEYTTAPGQ